MTCRHIVLYPIELVVVRKCKFVFGSTIDISRWSVIKRPGLKLSGLGGVLYSTEKYQLVILESR